MRVRSPHLFHPHVDTFLRKFMKTILLTILATLLVVVLVAAATTRIYVGQILGSQTIGQVITTTAAGVAGWANLPATTTVPNFADNIIPTGTVNGTNTTFTIPNMDTVTGNSLVLYRNGILQQGGGNDFTLTIATGGGGTVVFTASSIPQTGDILLCSYRY
jgi:hypothetical protein